MSITSDERVVNRKASVVASLIAATMMTNASAAAGQAESEVTFAKNIAPILQRSCQSCHRPGPGGGAPMSLLTYNEVRPWARAIKDRTQQRTMPPWFIEKDVGVQAFKDDPSLSDEEIARIGRWVDNGAPQGNPGDLPSPRTFPDGKEWTIGTPDLIVSSPEVTVKAMASDWHGYLDTTPTGMTEDRYVDSVEIHEVRVQGSLGKTDGLGGYSVLHHMGIVAGTPGDPVTPGPVGPIEGAFNMTHEAGQNATPLPRWLGDHPSRRIVSPLASPSFFVRRRGCGEGGCRIQVPSEGVLTDIHSVSAIQLSVE